MRLPDLRISPEGRSASNAPKRIVRFPLFTVAVPFSGKSSISHHLSIDAVEANWFINLSWRPGSPHVSCVSPDPRLTVDVKASCCELRSLACSNIPSDVGRICEHNSSLYYEKGTTMKLTGWMKTIFSGVLSIGVLTSSAAAQDTPREPTREVHLATA